MVAIADSLRSHESVHRACMPGNEEQHSKINQNAGSGNGSDVVDQDMKRSSLSKATSKSLSRFFRMPSERDRLIQ